MFTLILSGIAFICAILTKCTKRDHPFCTFFFGVIGIAALVLSVTMTMTAYSRQVFDIEEITRLEQICSKSYTLELAGIERDMRYRTKDPWIFHSFIPKR